MRPDSAALARGNHEKAPVERPRSSDPQDLTITPVRRPSLSTSPPWSQAHKPPPGDASDYGTHHPSSGVSQIRLPTGGSRSGPRLCRRTPGSAQPCARSDDVDAESQALPSAPQSDGGGQGAGRRRPPTPAPDPNRLPPADPGKPGRAPALRTRTRGECDVDSPRIPLQYERAVLAGAMVRWCGRGCAPLPCGAGRTTSPRTSRPRCPSNCSRCRRPHGRAAAPSSGRVQEGGRRLPHPRGTLRRTGRRRRSALGAPGRPASAPPTAAGTALRPGGWPLSGPDAVERVRWCASTMPSTLRADARHRPEAGNQRRSHSRGRESVAADITCFVQVSGPGCSFQSASRAWWPTRQRVPDARAR